VPLGNAFATRPYCATLQRLADILLAIEQWSELRFGDKILFAAAKLDGRTCMRRGYGFNIINEKGRPVVTFV
jgi:hypothetical protein